VLVKTPENLVFSSAQALAGAISRGEVSSIEVLEAHLRQIDKFNPALNAIVTLNREPALKRAAEADRALRRGERWGPLHGVPVTIKDSYETEGLRTTFGYRPMSHHVPERDATIVERMRAAGAIILGKTNIPEASFDWQCKSPIFGRTNNPWDITRTPGGSSGGGAAAVAAGFSPLDIGSDGAGSIRIPAHFCGVFGFKPTERRVSSAGHMELPGVPRGFRHTLSCGPLARTVQDLRLSLSVLAGPDERHWEVPPVPLDTPVSKRLNERRFAWTDDFGVPVAAEVRAALEKFVNELERQGCDVEKTAPKDFAFDAALETWGEVAGAEISTHIPFYLNIAARLSFKLLFGPGPWTRGFIRGLGMNMKQYVTALTRRDSFIAKMESFMANWDAWFCPVASIPAFEHSWKGRSINVDGQKVSYSMAAGAYVTIFNLTESPVVAMPIALSSEGLPLGVQIVGKRWKDMELLSVAEQLTEVVGEFKHPRGYVRNEEGERMPETYYQPVSSI
jgi:amidase